MTWYLVKHRDNFTLLNNIPFHLMRIGNGEGKVVSVLN
jgi:hypothetical protein